MGMMSNLLFVLLLIVQLNYGLPEQVCTCVEQNPVPFGFVLLSENAYILMQLSKVSWDYASRYCRNMGFDLVILETETDIAKLLSYVSNGEYVWIGLRRETTTSEWTWPDGTALNESSAIYKALPPSSYEPACVYAYGSGSSRSLIGDYCYRSYLYACQLNIDEAPRKLISMLNTATSFLNAVLICRSSGGRVPLMKTEDQYLRYLSDDRILDHSRIWVGLEDIDGDGEFKYIDGTKFTNSSFANWDDKQMINEKSPERVVYVNVADSKWYITKVTSSASYFCEFDQYCP